MSEQGEIYRLMPKVAAAIGAIGKDKTNDFHRYKFRGIDQVYDAAHGPLTENGIFVLTEILDVTREERTTKKGDASIYTCVRMKVSFVASDGSSVSTVTVGEGMDSGDKSSNKAMSAALKYAFFQTFTIPLSESKGLDADHDSPEPAPRDDRTSRLHEIAETAKNNGVTRKALSEHVKTHFGKPSTELSDDELVELEEWIYTKGAA